jgi:hypothetical protein
MERVNIVTDYRSFKDNLSWLLFLEWEERGYHHSYTISPWIDETETLDDVKNFLSEECLITDFSIIQHILNLLKTRIDYPFCLIGHTKIGDLDHEVNIHFCKITN